jgi:hypothetical protein
LFRQSSVKQIIQRSKNKGECDGRTYVYRLEYTEGHYVLKLFKKLEVMTAYEDDDHMRSVQIDNEGNVYSVTMVYEPETGNSGLQ